MPAAQCLSRKNETRKKGGKIKKRVTIPESDGTLSRVKSTRNTNCFTRASPNQIGTVRGRHLHSTAFPFFQCITQHGGFREEWQSTGDETERTKGGEKEKQRRRDEFPVKPNGRAAGVKGDQRSEERGKVSKQGLNERKKRRSTQVKT